MKRFGVLLGIASVAAVKDRSVSVRRFAIRALGDIGNKDDAELLREVIRTDDSDAEIGMPSIRDEARAALSKLSH
jgi:HEAT repeat protein